VSHAPADVLIRELVPADRRALAFAFGRLGKQSRFQRFLAAPPRADRDQPLRARGSCPASRASLPGETGTVTNIARG
jgi:hypothetical protein